MPRATKKHLGRKKPSKTRKNRKPLKKNKRRNMKKGGFLNMNFPFTTFDYSQRVTDNDIKVFVDEAYNLKSNKPIREFNEVGIHTAFAYKKQTDFPFKDNEKAYREQFNSIMKIIDNKEPNGNLKDYFNNKLPIDPKRIGCIITRATKKPIQPQGGFFNEERDLKWCEKNNK